VFGGSFDPVHHGHLIVAVEAGRALGLDEVRLVPARQQPFKQAVHLAPAEHRVAMLRLAIEGVRGLAVDDRELRRAGPSYTIDTLREIRAELPDAELHLLVGSDTARDFAQWREAGTIRQLATLVILSRPGTSVPADAGAARVLGVPAIDISATQVRERVRAGETIRFLVPETVARYIADRRLYVEED